MNLTHNSIERVDNHWAVLALGIESRDRAMRCSQSRMVNKAIGRQIQFAFDERTTDSDLLEKVSMAYELAAIEGLEAFSNPATDRTDLREQCIAGAWRVFDFRSLFPIPELPIEKVFHILHLSAVAYCGERWSDLRRWYNENPIACEVPSVADADWQHRLLFKMFDCWISLFRKNRWDDLDRIREVIAGLREDQKSYEKVTLDTGSNAKDRAMALRLIGLYNFAKSTELLALYMLQGEPADINSQLEKHFEASINAAIASSDSQLEILMRWLYAASRQMISCSSCEQDLGYKDIGSFWYKEVIKYEQLKEFGCLCVKLTLKGKNSLILHTIG